MVMHVAVLGLILVEAGLAFLIGWRLSREESRTLANTQEK